MPFSKRLVFASLIPCLVSVCCSSQPTGEPAVADQDSSSQTSPFEVDTTGWSDDRRTLEGEFLAWSVWKESLAEAEAQSTRRLYLVVQEKGVAQNELLAKLRRYSDDSNDPDVVGWAALRSAQIYLQFACQIDALHIPQNQSEAQKVAQKRSIADMVTPRLVQAAEPLKSIAGQGIPMWSAQAEAILSEIDPVTPESCEATTLYWRL